MANKEDSMPLVPVGIVVVSHSRALVKELIAFASVMKAGDFPLVNAGGMDENGKEFGTNALLIKQAIEEADQGSGTVVLADIGSGIMSAQTAIEMAQAKHKPLLADAPLLEGLVAAVASNVLGTTASELLKIIEQTRGAKKL